MALAVCVLPGVALLAALEVRRPLLVIVLAAPVSVAAAGLTGAVTGWLGLEFGAISLGALTLLAGAVGVLRLVLGQRGAPVSASRPVHPLPRHTRVVQSIGTMLAVVGTGIGVMSWLRGLGGLSTYPQEHDTIVHTLLTSYISRTGRGAPWELLPLDVLTGEPVYFYPAGMHLLAAVTADLTGDAVPALNAVTVVLLAVVLSVSAAVLAVVAARRLRLGLGAAALAGGFAALVAAGLYRPTFQLAHDGGGLPNAAALAMAPAVVAGLLMLSASPRRVAVAVGIACVGIVWLHPSAAVSVGVTVVAWWAGDAIVRNGRRELRRLPSRLAITAVTAAVLLVPFVLSSSASVTRTSSFPPDTAAAGFSNAVGATLGLAYGGYLDPPRATGQLWAAALMAVGIVAVLMLRRGLGVVAAWGAWTAITIAYFLSPATGIETVVTGFLYKAMVRVWSHVSLLVPVLVALGVVLAAARLAMLAKRGRGRRIFARPVLFVAVLVSVVFAGYVAGPGLNYAERNTFALASRYADPAFVRVGPDDRRAADWLAAKVLPGQRVLNSPNDGSTYLYVEHGIPIVNVYPLGLPQARYSYELLQSFNRYPRSAAVREMLRELNVAWVYVDADAPVIGAAGSPEGWAGDGLFDLAPGFQNLDELPGLQREFTAGSVSIYSLDLSSRPSQP